MLLLVKNKYSNYKNLNFDIWGIFKSSLILKLSQMKINRIKRRNKWSKIWSWKGVKVSKRVDWICRYFYKRFANKKKNYKNKKRSEIYFYRLDVPESSFIFWKRKKKIRIDIRLMQMFYLTLGIKRIRKFSRRAKLRDGLYSSNYLFFLECRIISIIYRSTLLANIFETIRFIRKGNVSINNKYVLFPNKSILLFTLIRLRFILKGYIYSILYKRLKRSAILSSIPKYMFFSYQFLFLFLFKNPKEKDLVNPFPLDFFKVSGLDLRK